MLSLPLNLRGIVATAIIAIALMVVYIRLNTKEKSEYQKTTGYIEYLQQELEGLPIRHPGKYRYLQLDSYAYPFELFIGKDAGDFKPDFEQLDKLRPGDRVTVYYYETDNTEERGLNRFAQYIDKETEPYFIRGNSNKILGIVIISMGIVLIIGAIILWKLKKIAF